MECTQHACWDGRLGLFASNLFVSLRTLCRRLSIVDNKTAEDVCIEVDLSLERSIKIVLLLDNLVNLGQSLWTLVRLPY